jgi:RNA polymerase sigma factor (sigma-70 family)
MALVASHTKMGAPWLAATAADGSASEQYMTRRVSEAVKRAQDGDREALGFLYVRYADNIYGYVLSIIHDPYEAEDVTQQVFAKLVRVIGKYEEREVPFFAWILRVARNLAVDHLRRQRVIPVEEVRVTSEHIGDPAGGQRITDLREALSVLPKDQCEVLVLRHFAGLYSDRSVGGLGPRSAPPWASGSQGRVDKPRRRSGDRWLCRRFIERREGPQLGSVRGRAESAPVPRSASPLERSSGSVRYGLLEIRREIRPLSISAR